MLVTVAQQLENLREKIRFCPIFTVCFFFNYVSVLPLEVQLPPLLDMFFQPLRNFLVRGFQIDRCDRKHLETVLC